MSSAVPVRPDRIIAANAAYRASWPDGRNVVGRTCYDVSHHYSVPCDRAGESCPLARSLASGQRERVLHLHHTPRGEEYVNIELSPVRDIFEEPLHPYSQLLIASLPSLDKKGVFQGIPGLPPSLLNKPTGCPFRPRCPQAFDRCVTEEPVFTQVKPGRWVSCHLYGEAL